MTKYRGEDDWPDGFLGLSFHEELASRSQALREWVAASSRRALSADGMTLFVARRHGVYSGVYSYDGRASSEPPGDGEPGMFVISVFHVDADATGYFQSIELAPDVEILRLDCGEDALRAVLRLTEDQRVALELHDVTFELAWPLSATGGLARNLAPSDATAGGNLALLGEFFSIGGLECGELAREALARRRDLDDRELRRVAAYRVVGERVGMALARNWRVQELGFPQAHAFDQAVARTGLEAHRELLRRVARPCWGLVPGTGQRRSRLGGVPDLPRGTAWPTEDGELLHFIAQVDLAELPALAGVQMPRQGLLSLFTGLLEPASDVEHRVLYTPDGVDTSPTDPPAKSYRDEYLQIEGSLSLVAEPAIALPSYGSGPYRHFLSDTFAGDALDSYLALQDALLGDPHEPPSLMLGYPDRSGDDPEATAAFRRAGRPDFRYRLREELATDEQRAHFDDVHEHLEEIVVGFLDWVPLFRLRSYPDMGLSFWDAGTLNVMIHRDDLAALRFDRTVAVISSS